MENLDRAEQERGKLKDVRIVYLPPATVAASRYEGDDPEYHAGQVMDAFVRDTRLWEVYPEMRLYGFNSPNPTDETGRHGYEFWVTIPADMEVPPPLEKKLYPGGTYAAHMIPMGNFEDWQYLDDWVKESGESGDYEYDPSASRGYENMFGALEEHLNYIEHVQAGRGPAQLDLLIRVKKKAKA